MSDLELETKQAEDERSILQSAIAEVERHVAALPAASRGFLEHWLQNARGQVTGLDKKIKAQKTESEQRTKEQAALIQMAEREAKLSADEKKTFGGFLEKDFFTKNDFASLDNFYAKSWDRLSEGGKNEMSHRVWEGIRKDEYTFTELPKTVKEKELQQAYRVLKAENGQDKDLAGDFRKDKGEFVRAFEDRRHEEAGRILERESFKRHMFLESESHGVKQKKIEAERSDDRAAIAQSVSTGARPEAEKALGPEKGSMGQADFSSLDLEEAPQKTASVSPADLPDLNGSKRGR